MQPSGPSDVPAHQTDIVDSQLESIRDRVDVEWPGDRWSSTEEPRARVPDDLIDQIGPQERGRKGGAPLEENVVDVAGKQIVEHRADVMRGAHESVGRRITNTCIARHIALTDDDAQGLPQRARSRRCLWQSAAGHRLGLCRYRRRLHPPPHGGDALLRATPHH